MLLTTRVGCAETRECAASMDGVPGEDEGRTQAQAEARCLQSGIRPLNIPLPAGEQAVIQSASRGQQYGEIGMC